MPVKIDYSKVSLLKAFKKFQLVIQPLKPGPIDLDGDFSDSAAEDITAIKEGPHHFEDGKLL
jgi:hypothetical protein